MSEIWRYQIVVVDIYKAQRQKNYLILIKINRT
jgi:hypothetical protein